MPLILTNPELEKSLEDHAKRQPCPTTKSELARAIIRSVIGAADAKGIHAGHVIEKLQGQRQKQTAA